MATSINLLVTGDPAKSYARVIRTEKMSSTVTTTTVLRELVYGEVATVQQSEIINRTIYNPSTGKTIPTYTYIVVYADPSEVYKVDGVTTDLASLTFSKAADGNYSTLLEAVDVGNADGSVVTITPTVSEVRSNELVVHVIAPTLATPTANPSLRAYVANSDTLGVSLLDIPTNADVTIDETVVHSTTPAGAKVIVITPNTGHKITTFSTLPQGGTWTNGTGNTFEVAQVQLEEDVTSYVCSLDFWMLQEGQTTLTITTETSVRPSAYTPFNRIYLMTPEGLEQLGKVILRAVPSTSEPYLTVDRSTSIIELLKVPFPIPSSILGDETEVCIADLKTNVMATEIISETAKIDLGVISVIDTDVSTVDYTAATYELVVPFVEDVINIPPSYVIGQTVRIELIIDLYTGGSTLNLYRGSDEVPFLSEKVDVGRSVPFRSTVEVEGDLSSKGGIDNETSFAYIRKLQKELQPGKFSNLVEREGLLGNLVGAGTFAVVEEIDLNVNATLSEKLQIQQILKLGVLIR